MNGGGVWIKDSDGREIRVDDVIPRMLELEQENERLRNELEEANKRLWVLRKCKEDFGGV